jgi:hypothetical protein
MQYSEYLHSNFELVMFIAYILWLCSIVCMGYTTNRCVPWRIANNAEQTYFAGSATSSDGTLQQNPTLLSGNLMLAHIRLLLNRDCTLMNILNGLI